MRQAGLEIGDRRVCGVDFGIMTAPRYNLVHVLTNWLRSVIIDYGCGRRTGPIYRGLYVTLPVEVRFHCVLEAFVVHISEEILESSMENIVISSRVGCMLGLRGLSCHWSQS